MIEGRYLRLRPWIDSDIPALTALRNDISIQAQLLSRTRGSNPIQIRDWLNDRSSHNDRLFYVIAESATNRCGGFLQIDKINLLDRRAELGICVLPDFQGRGFAKEAISLVKGHLVAYWNLRKLNLSVRADNTVARRAYHKIGFQECGQLRSHVFLEGDWHDVVLMEWLLVETSEQ